MFGYLVRVLLQRVQWGASPTACSSRSLGIDKGQEEPT